jgi:hypothetical protein
MMVQVWMVSRPFRFNLLAAAILSCAVPAAAAELLFAHGNWAALRFGERCEARSKAIYSTGQAKPTAYAGIAFDSGTGVHGQFYIHLSRSQRSGSTVMLNVGGQPFLLIGRNDWAWSRSPGQASSIIAAARIAGSMSAESRDSSGRRFVDRFGLAGVPTAIDAAAAACAGKFQPH